MSAALSIIPAPRAIPSGFMPAAEAAALMGLNPDAMTRRCRTELAQRGQAVHVRPPGGGQLQWFLSRDIDARLWGGGVFQAPDLSEYSEKQRAGAFQRKACVEQYRIQLSNNPLPVKQWLPQLLRQLSDQYPGLKPSRSRLYAWHQAYSTPMDLVKLIDQRGQGRKCADSPEAWSMFEDLYLHGNQPSLDYCWGLVSQAAQEHGWTWCSLASCYAQRDKRIPLEKQTYHRRPKLWRQQLRPYIPQAPESWSANQRWISDHKQLDIWCRFGPTGTLLRPWLTTWLDWRTRKVVGRCISANPNSSTILAALRNGLLDPVNLGGPAEVAIDNGKDYACYSFHGSTKSERRESIDMALDETTARGIFHMLSIDPHFSQPYNPNGKSRQERFFRSLSVWHKTFDTYAGDCPENRPERLAKILKQPAKIPTFDAVRGRLNDFLDGYNIDATHDIDDLVEETGERLSPDAAFRAWVKSKRVMADPCVYDLLLQHWHKPVTVGRNGITLNLRGRAVSYGNFDPALTPYKALRLKDRKELLVSYDPDDISTIRVYDTQYRAIAVVTMNQLGGAHGSQIALDHVGELNKANAQYKKSLKHVAAHQVTKTLTTQEQLAELAAQVPPVPSPAGMTIQIVETPADGAARDFKRMETRRAVVGGPEAAQDPGFVSAIDMLNHRRRQDQTSSHHDDEFPIDPWSKLRPAP